MSSLCFLAMSPERYVAFRLNIDCFFDTKNRKHKVTQGFFYRREWSGRDYEELFEKSNSTNLIFVP